jgi:hypothetical protein
VACIACGGWAIRGYTDECLGGIADGPHHAARVNVVSVRYIHVPRAAAPGDSSVSTAWSG